MYYLEHIDKEKFFVLTNHNAPNFKVVETNTIKNLSTESMKEVVAHDKHIFISDIFYKNNNLVLEIRENGLPEIIILNLNSKNIHKIIHSDNAYTVSLNSNNEKNGENGFYFNFSSLKTPDSINFFSFTSMKNTMVWQKKYLILMSHNM